MRKNNAMILGIDTSNYTTSAALCTLDGDIVANVKKLLPVAKGNRGLRQSEALFHHTVQLPQVLEEIQTVLAGRKLLAVGYSKTPRDEAGSYMPCFLAGQAAASAAACAADVPLYSFSHQGGHVMAALYGAGTMEHLNQPFAAFHVSGGTTEILLVRPDQDRIFSIERIGGTLDLNAGQVIDRAGVMMGMPFPAGPAMEQAAESFMDQTKPCKPSVRDLYCNLSGLENKAQEMFEKDGNAGSCAAFVLQSVLHTLQTLTKHLLEIYPGLPIVYAGGVMSCSYIREALSVWGSFAAPAFSSDNAAGAALLALHKYKERFGRMDGCE